MDNDGHILSKYLLDKVTKPWTTALKFGPSPLHTYSYICPLSTVEGMKGGSLYSARSGEERVLLGVSMGVIPSSSWLLLTPAALLTPAQQSV